MEKKDEKMCDNVLNGSSSTNEEMKEDINGSIRKSESMLRLVPMALCVAALVVMLKSSQFNQYGSFSYSNLAAFRYLVHANGVCAGYSLISAIISAMPRSSTMPKAWTFFLLDQAFTYIILGAGASSTEVLYLAYKGDDAITWSEACSYFGGFCVKATTSVVITYVAVAFYAVLSLISSYKLFSQFDAPIANSKGIEVSTV